MKIVHVCLSGYYTDNWSYQENLLTKYQAQQGHDIVIIASNYRYSKGGILEKVPIGEYMVSNNVRVIRLKYKKFTPKKLNILSELYFSICKEKPDMIFAHNVQSISLLTIARYIKKNDNTYLVVDNHCDYYNSAHGWLSKNILHRIIWKNTLKLATPYIKKAYGVTPWRTNFLYEMYGFPKNKLDTLLMGADTDKINFESKNEIRYKIRKELNILQDDFVIITGGKIDQYKNIHLLMRSVNEINNITIKLIVFGNADNNMKNVIENLSKNKTIRFIGWIESSNVYDYFLASDLAAFPGTHSVLWEQAVGTGLPCVFKKWEGMQHVDVGGNCEFINIDSVEEIKNIILDIYNDKNKYNRMKNIAIEKGIPYFSYEEIARRAIGK